MTQISRQFPLRDYPSIIKILLKDRTTGKNIIWATSDYEDMGFNLKPKDEIDYRWITNGGNAMVQPRVKKDQTVQKERTKDKAEVFTPTWIVKKQNDLIEDEIKNLPLLEYVNKTWLEITCGEAPYMCSRYDTVTGQPIDISDRVGFVDRKLQRITNEIEPKDEWLKLVIKSFQASYGYEYQGDSLLIARENLVYTFIDYFLDKFDKLPSVDEIENIATIVSHNVFQMNGLTYTVPYSEELLTKKSDIQLSLFNDHRNQEEQISLNIEKPNSGKKVRIKDWKYNKLYEVINIKLEGEINMKFDVVIGNPPYQETNEDRNRDDAIYPYFYDAAKVIGEKYVLITPARFLYGVGSTPEKWNNEMLNDSQLRVVYYNENSSEVFPNTDIKGGIVIIHRDKHKNFGAIETFTPFEQLNNIVKKVSFNANELDVEFGELMFVQTKFNLNNLYEDNPNFKNILGSGGKERRLTSSIFSSLPEIFTDSKKSKNDVRIYGRQNNKRVYKWIDKKYIEADGNFPNYKVFVPAANGSGKLGEIISSPIIGKPNTGHTQTFISIGNFKNNSEAEALLKYLKTKFARIMLGVKKTTQNNKTKSTWSKVPVQNFSSNSDINWHKEIHEIDQQLYSKYNLSTEEIKFIEKMGEEMK